MYAILFFVITILTYELLMYVPYCLLMGQKRALVQLLVYRAFKLCISFCGQYNNLIDNCLTFSLKVLSSSIGKDPQIIVLIVRNTQISEYASRKRKNSLRISREQNFKGVFSQCGLKWTKHWILKYVLERRNKSTQIVKHFLVLKLN